MNLLNKLSIGPICADFPEIEFALKTTAFQIRQTLMHCERERVYVCMCNVYVCDIRLLKNLKNKTVIDVNSKELTAARWQDT